MIFRSIFLAYLSTVALAAASEWFVEVVDPNPGLVLPSGAVLVPESVEDMDRLRQELPRRNGVVADGVSQLLLRVASDDPVKLSIPPRYGRLIEARNDARPSARIEAGLRTAEDGTKWSFIYYVPPLDFPRGALADRTFTIAVSSGASTTNVVLKLLPPPVLLVHGLWSDAATWDGLRGYLNAQGFPICVTGDCSVNFGVTQPAPSFDPGATGADEQFAVNEIINATAHLLHGLRDRGIAATQVDVVAHSLGGLLARSRMALNDGPRALRRVDNFYRGDFHKLITVGTPHRGTPVASLLIEHRETRSSFFNGQTLEEFLAASGRPIGPAIEQMQPGSQALASLGGAAGVASHAIIGVAPPNSETERMLDSLAGALGLFVTLDSLLGGNGRHDTLVPIASQAGGLPASATTRVRRTVHKALSGADNGETQSRLVWQKVAALLRAPASGRRFGEFTGPE